MNSQSILDKTPCIPSVRYTENIIGNFPQLLFLREYLEGHNGFIAGGCFKNIFRGEKVKDLDVFFTAQRYFEQAVEYYERQKSKWEKVYENEKCVSFYDGKMRIELIRSVFGSPKQVLNEFDFTIVKFALYEERNDDFDTSRFYCVYHLDFFEHLHTKKLVVDNKMPYPFGTYERTYRYAKYGFFPCRGTRLKIIREVQETPFDEDAFTMYLTAGWD